MTRKTLWRLIKAFLVSALGVYLLLRAPYLYAQIKYIFSSHEETPVHVSGPAVITPVLLPVSKMSKAVVKKPQTLPAQAKLIISKIGVNVPIVFGIDGNDFKAMYDRLNQGVVHYAATPKPGQNGTAMIIGHSSDYIWKKNPYASVFALLNKLNPGDVITVQYGDGSSYRFVVKQAVIYDPKNDDPAKFTSLENTPTPSLLLITCWPVNSTSKRYMVQAILES